MNNNIIVNIAKIKNKKNAVLLSHFYQLPEVQNIADYVGDSYGLAKKAIDIKADIIIFAGVKFMAETAKILNPDKKVLLPNLEAGCSLADSCKYKDFIKFKKKYPDHIIITYVNTTAEIKSLSDITCTSSNAVEIVNSLPKDQKIIFAPDKNLGNYINKITGKNMVLWDGVCHVHNQLHVAKVIEMKGKYKSALVIAHPECQGPILNIADFVGSTSQMIEFTKKSNKKEFIIATETGITYKMQENSPKKKFYIVPADENCACNDCEYMKMINLENILYSIENEVFEINLDAELIEKAKKPLLKMMEIVEKT